MSDTFTPSTFCPRCPEAPEVDPRASAALCREHYEPPVGSEDAVVSLLSISNWAEAGPNRAHEVIR